MRKLITGIRGDNSYDTHRPKHSHLQTYRGKKKYGRLFSGQSVEQSAILNSLCGNMCVACIAHNG